MKKLSQIVIAATALGTGMAALPAAAAEGDILVRFGAASVMPNDDSGEVEPLSDTSVEVDDGNSLAFTISYMYSDNIGLSVLGALPFEHDIKGKGSPIDGVDVGSIEHLPPTFIVEYYFNPGSDVRPYVGAGINYTIFSNEDADSELEAITGDTDIDLDDSTGLAVMAGVDMDINEDWFFNASLWYIDIETTAELETANVGDLEVDVDIDPWVVMLGVGTRF